MPWGVALAMRHGLEWFIHLWAQRPRVGDEHPAYAPAGAWLPLPFNQQHWSNWYLNNDNNSLSLYDNIKYSTGCLTVLRTKPASWGAKNQVAKGVNKIGSSTDWRVWRSVPQHNQSKAPTTKILVTISAKPLLVAAIFTILAYKKVLQS